MKTIFTVIAVVLFTTASFGQAPFTTVSKEPRFLEKRIRMNGETQFREVKNQDTIENLYKKIDIYKDKVKSIKNDSIKKLPLNQSTNGLDNLYKNVIDYSYKKETDPLYLKDSSYRAIVDLILNYQIVKSYRNDSVDFFKNNGLTLYLTNKEYSSLALSSQVFFYKLYVANPTDDNNYRINRYNIPFMIISKLSNSSDSVPSSSAFDVLDYEGAPLTLRIMPSCKITSFTYTGALFFGFYLDARGVNLSNTLDHKINMKFFGSGGIGLTYQGDGEGGIYNSSGEYKPGRYSLSVILQGAVGNKDNISRLFYTEKSHVGSFQGYFFFKFREDNPLSFKLGYQYFFQDNIAGNRSNFSLALGI